MFFPLMLSAVRLANPLMARSLCERLLSGTNERGCNDGRRLQTAIEGFLRFLLSRSFYQDYRYKRFLALAMYLLFSVCNNVVMG